ncbi:hypothetical protein C8F04DRAFT_1191757 [Mycena alexandri]|uniref:Uncharacterized protein n=1 Tax=Mycena alexandri TaxID=1745969 RepID=A0AAD6SDX7_9AGAR|nr:hypothetical protein C8F04DRAFT_1191757 [Mycena alexandri]
MSKLPLVRMLTYQDLGIYPSATRAVEAAIGRIVRKLVSLFDPIEALVAEYDRRQELEDTEEVDGDDEPVAHTAEQDCLHRGFLELVKWIPSVRTALVTLAPGELADLYAKLAKGANGDDVNSVRAAMVEFIGKGAKDPLVATSRHNRGLESDVTGPLLFPVEYDYSDPEIRAKVINGDPDFPVTADSWPRSLYQNGVYDPTDGEKGLFKSLSLLQTYLHIFTSPKSAVKLETDAEQPETENIPPSEPPRKKRKVTQVGKKSVAAKVSMRRVTPRSIAYAAVHHRFALSDAPQWNETDGAFDYILYYNNIVDWFEDAPGPVAQKTVDDLLAWWD